MNRRESEHAAAEFTQTSTPLPFPWRKALGFLTLLLLAIVFLHNYKWIAAEGVLLYKSMGPEFMFFVMAGFLAQMIDGALGMAYGVSASTFLMSVGVPPAAASASIHTSEIFTSGVSGLMHLKFQNV